jgi:hypothetical protein
MDMGSIASAVGSLKTAGEIAKGLINLHTMAEVQAKSFELGQQIIDAQQQIFAAHAAQTTLIDKVRELEGQIARMKNWETQKQRYKLAAPFSGCMVFALQKSMSGGETAHYLCTTCFNKGQPSILQGKEYADRSASYYCYICKTDAPTQSGGIPDPEYFEDIHG